MNGFGVEQNVEEALDLMITAVSVWCQGPATAFNSVPLCCAVKEVWPFQEYRHSWTALEKG